MKTYTRKELKEVLAQHVLWLDSNGAEGTLANLRWADLREADLTGAHLTGAHLTGAYLREADLSGATLRRANLREADLSGADLTGANLRWANLRDATLTGANLREADLNGADLTGARLPGYMLCPQEGDFIGFKKLACGVIAKLKIPAEAARTSSLVGRKCRAEFAEVIGIAGEHGPVIGGYSTHDTSFKYQVGCIVRPDKYDPDIRLECTHGIHFFITREEAEAY